jgi:hypothetical protein
MHSLQITLTLFCILRQVGTDYYQETLLHLALQGARDFLLFNPTEFQLSSADNEIFADTLKELDAHDCEL